MDAGERKILEALISWALAAEEIIDGEYGAGRSANRMREDDDIDSAIIAAEKLLKESEKTDAALSNVSRAEGRKVSD